VILNPEIVAIVSFVVVEPNA